jgi:hypothetical protein
VTAAKENSKLKENISAMRTQLAENEEESMYSLFMFMYYTEEFVSQMCLVLNSLNYHVIACLFTTTYIFLITLLRYTINICYYL